MRELNRNIQGYNADGICVGCLNYNRKMIYSDEVKECFKTLGKIDVPDRLKIQVCWECLSVVQAVNRFQSQIVKSYDVLTDYSKKHRYLESPLALTKHAVTRLSSHVVSITSTQWAEDEAAAGKKVAADDVEDLEDHDATTKNQARPADEVGTGDVKLELEGSDVYVDPLASSDSDNETTESLQPEAMSESEDEVIQFAKLLQRGGIRRRQVPARRTRQHSAATPEDTLPTVKSNDQLIMNMTTLIADNQKKVLNSLQSLSSRVNGMCSRAEHRPHTSADIDATHTHMAADNYPLSLKKITCRQELEEMERLLRDDDYKTKLVSSCSIICSRSPGKGINCAYRLLDILFCRHFLCECSWAGGTRSEGEKIGFKFYKNVLDFFFRTVLQWDPLYTQEENETFCKVVIKNAKKRSESKHERSSTKRIRKRSAKANW